MSSLEEFINSPVPTDEIDLSKYAMKEEDDVDEIYVPALADMGKPHRPKPEHNISDKELELRTKHMLDKHYKDSESPKVHHPNRHHHSPTNMGNDSYKLSDDVDETKELDLDEIKNAIGETLSKYFN